MRKTLTVMRKRTNMMRYPSTCFIRRRPRLDSMRKSSSTASNPSVEAKPTVVLAGWLGSQPSKLRRYQEFYATRGYPTILRIASPGMVVASVRPNALGPRVPVKPPCVSWTPESHERAPAAGTNPNVELRTMQDLAWDTLRELHRLEASRFVMHSFSNGGCFLYEQVQRILSTRHEQADPDLSTALMRLEMVGGVFDSCPALDLSRIDGALAYCTAEELEQLDAMLPNYRTELSQYLSQRQDEYHQYMLESCPDMPQLYIYSRNDPLVPFQPLDALVEDRAKKSLKRIRSRVAGQRQPPPPPVVRKLVLDDSPHCAHYLYHRDLYEAALDSFLALLGSGEMQSERSKL
jgi:Eukaryotic protein of unknown function (DUF829)